MEEEKHESDNKETTRTNSTTIRQAGIANLGNTGYMDVILQQFFMSNSFRNFVLQTMKLPSSAEEEQEDVANTTTRKQNRSNAVAAAVKRCLENNIKVATELKNLFSNLNFAQSLPTLEESMNIQNTHLRISLPTIRSMMMTQDPSEFYNAWGTLKGRDVYKPSDAFEFANELIDCIREVQHKTKRDIFEKVIFFSTLVRYKPCIHCCCADGSSSSSSSPSSSSGCSSHDLTLSIENTDELAHALVEYLHQSLMNCQRFGRPLCSTCSGTLKQRLDIQSVRLDPNHLPDLLMIHLKQYKRQSNGLYVGISKRATFDETLDLTHFVDTTDEQGEILEWETETTSSSYKYNLVGVVIHEGTTERGAYFCYIKERNNNKNRWLKARGESMEPVDFAEVQKVSFGGITTNTGESTNAYMIFYEREEASKTTD